ncbi:hypothetical protein AB3S75_000634 [Citrus x aurantiifolia]
MSGNPLEGQECLKERGNRWCWCLAATIATLVLSCHLQVWNPEQAISDISRRKVMMMSSHRAPYALGDTRVTMARPKGRDLARVS